MIYLLYTIHIVISLFLIAIVLLQQGKGADLSVFGGGATQTAFGARGATTLLHKLTVGAFVGFIVTTLLIGVVQTRRAATANPVSTLPEAEAALPAEEEKTPATATEAPAAAPTEAPATSAPAGGAAAPAEAPAPPAEAPAPPAGGGGSGN